MSYSLTTRSIDQIILHRFDQNINAHMPICIHFHQTQNIHNFSDDDKLILKNEIANIKKVKNIIWYTEKDHQFAYAITASNNHGSSPLFEVHTSHGISATFNEDFETMHTSIDTDGPSNNIQLYFKTNAPKQSCCTIL